MKRILAALCCVAALALAPAPAFAQRKLAILMPGAGGIHPADFLVRNKASFDGAGFDTLLTTSPAEAARAAQAAAQERRKAVIVGMSRGAGHAAQAVAAGANPAGVVLVSAVFDDVMAALGSPAALPRTLLVHHREDECPLTSPEQAQDFARWSRGKAQIRWINTRGMPAGRPCGPHGAHGFFHHDGPAVAAIIGFIRAR